MIEPTVIDLSGLKSSRRITDWQSYELHASQEAIEIHIKDTERDVAKATRELNRLKALLTKRIEQKAAGEWPPKDCPCEFHQTHKIPAVVLSGQQETEGR